ncbi:hypothetical protein IGI04_021188 [Brassica rapa subsp. trilocularis]|uniref:Nuclear transcription factor Y subunit n=1 Tax=Brassica rapa subsp. trilocularis TaxID=1813537 RepID=A0ABQ7MPD5_BRACM|nr:hypothetical protein IGI04_021188 [Brassica rapa subsp. trilocularis]
MAMQTVRESLLSGPQIPWWNAFGSQPLAPVSLAGDSESLGETEHGVDKQSNSAFQLPFSLGGVKSSIDVPKPHGAAFSVQPPPCLELGFSQPQIYTKYPSVEQEYYGGVVSAYGSQSRVMLPLNMETEDGTIYVNSKQYHGIIRRRQPVQKLLLFFITTNLVSEVPYMHHSRHLHALRRPRGSGGRFLNTKADGTEQTQPQPQESNSQSSEVVHPESEIMNLSHELYVSVSEVTSMNYFLSSSVHPLGGVVMPSMWFEAAAVDNGCFNFNT